VEETRNFEERLAKIYRAIASNKASALARTLGIKAPSVATAYKRQLLKDNADLRVRMARLEVQNIDR